MGAGLRAIATSAPTSPNVYWYFSSAQILIASVTDG